MGIDKRSVSLHKSVLGCLECRFREPGSLGRNSNLLFISAHLYWVSKMSDLKQSKETWAGDFPDSKKRQEYKYIGTCCTWLFGNYLYLHKQNIPYFYKKNTYCIFISCLCIHRIMKHTHTAHVLLVGNWRKNTGELTEYFHFFLHSCNHALAKNFPQSLAKHQVSSCTHSLST